MDSYNNIVFFDGLCTLCHKSVRTLIAIDSEKKLRYSSIQGLLLSTLFTDRDTDRLDGILFWRDGILYEKAEAITQILFVIAGKYSFFIQLLSFVPLFILNFFYFIISKNRYFIFGKEKVCGIPTSEDKKYFIP